MYTNKSGGFPTHEHATYSCPWAKHGFSKFSPHTRSDCPCALLMVIAKASCTGNCRRLNSNGISVIIIGMHDNRISSPLNLPFKMVASMILFIIFFIKPLMIYAILCDIRENFVNQFVFGCWQCDTMCGLINRPFPIPNI